MRGLIGALILVIASAAIGARLAYLPMEARVYDTRISSFNEGVADGAGECGGTYPEVEPPTVFTL